MSRVIRVAGPQGSGVDTLAQLLARALLKAGFEARGRREYHSNIMGRHSYLDVAFGAEPPLAFPGKAHAMLALDAESIARHLGGLYKGALLLYPEGIEEEPLAQLPFLDPRPLDALTEQLGEKARIEDVLSAHEKMGVRPMAYAKKGPGRSQNVAALAALFKALGLPAGALLAAIEERFGDRPAALKANQAAFKAVFPEDVRPAPRRGDRVFLTGAQAAALGKVAGGLEVQSYYPISPATDESTYLEARSEAGVNVVQLEDELAAIHFAIGAALGGRRAATATSGPGFSLMAEALGFAGIAEVPLVVTLYMRGGPSTGLPTRNEQGDLLFSLFAGHGEFPRLVLASGDALEAFEDAAWALELAQAYETPVIHLLDKEIASSFQGLSPEALKAPPPRPKKAAPAPTPYPRFAAPFLPVGTAGTYYWITSDEHDAWGHITEDPVLRRQMMEKRAQKLARAAAEIPPERKFALFGEGKKTLVGFGSVKGAAIQAARQAGWRYLHLRLLWPFPAEVRPLLEGGFAVVEENASGQLARLIRQETGLSPRFSVRKYTGRPVFSEELYQALMAGKDAVLTEGV